MDSKETQKQTLELLAQNEEKLEELYKIYAERFPGQREFWLRLAREEAGHAVMIRKLTPDIQAERLVFKEDRFEIKAIDSMIRYTENLIQKAKEEGQELIKALSLSVHLERSLLERKFFEICEGDTIEFQKTLEFLKTSTIDHLARVEKMWKELGGK